MEKDLRGRAESLSSQKQLRLQQLKQRLQVDEQLCDSLGMTPFHLPPSCVVPTEQQLADLDEHIRELETEKVPLLIDYCEFCWHSVVVTLRQARLVPGWVTVFVRVNHLGAEPGTQACSAWACSLCVGWYEYPAKGGGVNRHIVWLIH